MKLALHCSGNIQKVIAEILAARGIPVEDGAAFSLVEKGFPPPEHGVTVVFDPTNLDELLEFLDGLKPDVPPRADSETVVGKRRDVYEIIKLDEVFFFQAEDNDTYCRTKQHRYEIKKKLYELESSLKERGFVRVSKSYLMNILMVSEIVPWLGGRLLLKCKDLDAEIEVSRKNVPAFKSFIGL